MKLPAQQVPPPTSDQDSASKSYVHELFRATAEADYLRAGLSADQFNPALNEAVVWNVEHKKRGQGITLNQSNGQFTLKGGRTYKVEAQLFLAHSAAFFQQWAVWNVTDDVLVPGSIASLRSTTASANWSFTDSVTATLDPLQDTVYEIRLVDNSTANVDIAGGTALGDEGAATNLEIYELGATAVTTPGGLEFMDVINVSGATGSVTFGEGGDGVYNRPLDGDVDEEYVLVTRWKNANQPNLTALNLRPNGLTTDQDSQKTSNGTSTAEPSVLRLGETLYDELHSVTDIKAKTGGLRSFNSGATAVDLNGGLDAANQQYSGVWGDVAVNITSLEIITPAGSFIDDGSQFVLYRRRIGVPIRADSAAVYERRVESALAPGSATVEQTTGHTTYGGSVIGLSARLEEAVTAGTVTVNLKVDGVTTLSLVLDSGTPTSTRATAALNEHTVAVDKNISVEIITAGYDNSGSVVSGISVNVTLTNQALVYADPGLLETRNTFLKSQSVQTHNLGTQNGAVAIDAALSNTFALTVDGAATIGAPTNLEDGQTIILRVRQDGTGSRDVQFNAVWDFGEDGPPDTTSAAADSLMVVSGTSDGTNIFCSAKLGYTNT